MQDSIEELLLGKADNANRAFGDTHRHLVQNSVGFYAQDDWKIQPRLTLSFGLRYDINGNLRDLQDRGRKLLSLVAACLKSDKELNRLYNVDYHDFGPPWLRLGHLRNRQDGFARRVLLNLRRPEFRHLGLPVFFGGRERRRLYPAESGAVFGFDFGAT